MSLFSCTIEGSSDQNDEKETRTAKDYGITLLFEYDSVKVYRFVDIDTRFFVYFTSTNGSTQYNCVQKIGKHVPVNVNIKSLNTKQ